MTPTLRALKVAEIVGIPDSVALYGIGRPTSVSDLPVFIYVVEREVEGPLVFDTGCAPPARAATCGHPRVDPDGYRTAAEALSDAGVDPASVATVVLSHLHWDHCYGLTAFPAAEILVQRRELQVAFAPPPEYHAIYESFESGQQAHWLASVERIRPLDGWTDLGGGVSVVALPGHTDGSQGLVVDSGTGRRWCLVGDLFASYDSWTGLARPDGRPTGVIPNGLHSDLGAWHRSVEEVARCGWTPLPAHDRRVELVLDGSLRPRHARPATVSG